jgi:hypothetical protein
LHVFEHPQVKRAIEKSWCCLANSVSFTSFHIARRRAYIRVAKTQT